MDCAIQVGENKIILNGGQYGPIEWVEIRPGEGWLNLEIGADKISLHSVTPEQIIDLGKRIETAGCEAANRMRFEASCVNCGTPGTPRDCFDGSPRYCDPCFKDGTNRLKDAIDAFVPADPPPLEERGLSVPTDHAMIPGRIVCARERLAAAAPEDNPADEEQPTKEEWEAAQPTPEGPPIDHPDGCACESCRLAAEWLAKFDGVPF